MNENTIFNGTEWVSYEQAVSDVTKEDCYALLYSLLEETAETKPNKELTGAIKALVQKMFP